MHTVSFWPSMSGRYVIVCDTSKPLGSQCVILKAPEKK